MTTLEIISLALLPIIGSLAYYTGVKKQKSKVEEAIDLAQLFEWCGKSIPSPQKLISAVQNKELPSDELPSIIAWCACISSACCYLTLQRLRYYEEDTLDHDQVVEIFHASFWFLKRLGDKDLLENIKQFLLEVSEKCGIDGIPLPTDETSFVYDLIAVT